MQSLKKYASGRLYECRKAETGVWYIHWTENRRSKRKSTGARNLRDAQAVFDEFCALIETQGERRDFTCAELYRMKYDMSDERPTPAWKHLEPHFGSRRPAEITAEMEAKYIRSRNAAPSTIRYELSCLRASWNHAVRKRILRAEDLPVLEPLPPASAPRDRWLTDDEIDRLFAALDRADPRTGLFLWLGLHTAARRNAILELAWDQVDLDVGVIHYLRPGAQQTRKRRASVPISAALRPVLEDAKARATSRYVVGPMKINEALARLGKRAKVPGLTPHVLRHTAATIMARNGVSLWVIAQVLGNTVEQVEKVYAKWSPGRHADAVNVIGRRSA